jgi:hypothetical protein
VNSFYVGPDVADQYGRGGGRVGLLEGEPDEFCPCVVVLSVGSEAPVDRSIQSEHLEFDLADGAGHAVLDG